MLNSYNNLYKTFLRLAAAKSVINNGVRAQTKLSLQTRLLNAYTANII
jgi:hypothetical protein